MPLRRLGPALLALTLGATISWEGLARRGDDAPAAAPAPAPTQVAPPSSGAPAVWVTAFEDGTLRPALAEELGLGTRSTQGADPIGRCDTWEARAGRCVEFVRFVRREQLFGRGSVDRPLDEAQRDADRLTLAMRRGLSSLYLALWDGLVARWRREGEALGAQLAELEVSTLPDSNALWGPADAVSRRITALPDAARWLLEDEWLAPDKAGEGRAPFRRLRITAPQPRTAEGQPAVRLPPGLALLRGRFAVGFVFDAKPFDADLIRLSDRGAMIFLRQLYPHAVDELARGGSAVAGCLGSNAPLECMRADELPVDSPRWIQTLAPGDDAQTRAEIAKQAARDQFTAFADLVGMRLLQYGRFEFDISLIRAMGTLVAMTAPPAAGSAATLIGDDINDSIVGESDTPSTGRRARALRPPTSSTSIYYDAIPEDDVKALKALLELTGDERCLGGAQTVPELAAADDPEAQAPRLLDLTFTRLGDLVNKNSPLHYRVAEDTFTEAELEAVTQRYLDLGDEAFRAALLTHDDLAPNSEQLAGAELDRLILENRLEGRCAPATEATLSPAEQVRRLERLRSRVLFAQVRDTLTPKFPKAGDDPGTPEGVEAEAQSAWTAVMTQHGSTPKRVERDGGENVHPLAVCTTKDGAEAMAEPVFKRVSVEVLLVADTKATPEQALWESRAALPFLWVDDPKKSEPVVTPLVQLGQGLTIYKARWELWAGWHLLWGVEGDGDQMTLSGHASAICEDMVLTPPALVATLVRGGLLDAPLRGTRPVRRADVPEREAPPPPPTTSDERLSAVQSAAETGQAAVGAAELSAGQLASNPENSLTMARSKAGQASDLAKALSERPELTGRDTPAAEYLRELVQGPLLTRAQGQAAVLIVADVTQERGRARVRQLVPSTPYLQRRERLGHGERLWLAAWALVLPPLPMPLQEPNVAMLPARLPNASVQATSVRPGWGRDPLTELTLVADIGLFGRVVNIGCDAGEFGEGYPAFAGCGPLSEEGRPPYIRSVYSIGPHLSLASLGTTWLSHEPRVAVEYGAEAQFELVVRETSGDDYLKADQVRLYNTILARGGVLVGVRLAVDPVWMTRLVRGVRLESGAPMPRLWGAEGDNGRSQLARTQVGLRAGASLEPWTNLGGPPLVLSAEAWMGWSRWRSRSAWSMITPYQPSALVGPYVRYLYTIQAPWWESSKDELDPLQLLNRHQLVIGVRVQPRFDAARINLPEPQ